MKFKWKYILISSIIILIFLSILFPVYYFSIKNVTIDIFHPGFVNETVIIKVNNEIVFNRYYSSNDQIEESPNYNKTQISVKGIIIQMELFNTKTNLIEINTYNLILGKYFTIFIHVDGNTIDQNFNQQPYR